MKRTFSWGSTAVRLKPLPRLILSSLALAYFPGFLPSSSCLSRKNVSPQSYKNKGFEESHIPRENWRLQRDETWKPVLARVAFVQGI